MTEHRVRQLLPERSGGLCELCTGARAAEAHHRKNRSQGGLWLMSNMLHLCSPCHVWVTGHPERARAEGGWSVRGHEEPAAVPVLMRRYRSWMRLNDEGDLAFSDPPLAA